jgi:hypothetical protein
MNNTTKAGAAAILVGLIELQEVSRVAQGIVHDQYVASEGTCVAAPTPTQDDHQPHIDSAGPPTVNASLQLKQADAVVQLMAQASS